jgi:hypothetical protein
MTTAPRQRLNHRDQLSVRSGDRFGTFDDSIDRDDPHVVATIEVEVGDIATLQQSIDRWRSGERGGEDRFGDLILFDLGDLWLAESQRGSRPNIELAPNDRPCHLPLISLVGWPPALVRASA